MSAKIDRLVCAFIPWAGSIDRTPKCSTSGPLDNIAIPRPRQQTDNPINNAISNTTLGGRVLCEAGTVDQAHILRPKSWTGGAFGQTSIGVGP